MKNNASIDATKKNREFGLDISNINKKEIRYPKPSNSKKNENFNNIKIYPKDDCDNVVGKNSKINKKKDKSKNKINKNKGKKSKSKPNRKKINLLIKKINRISITKEEKKNGNLDDNYNNKIIYNENPIEEYEEEIMKNLFTEELNYRPDYSLFPSLLDNNKNNNNYINLTYMKRFSFINLFISFQHELLLKQETLYLCINIFDRFIQKLNTTKIILPDLNKIAVTCLFISSKYEEIYPPYLNDFLQIFKLKYRKHDLLLTEQVIISELNFEILIVYPITFLKKFCLYDLDDMSEKEKTDMKLCYNGAQFFLELCLIEPKFCELKPSLQAAICLYLARKILIFQNGKGKIWNYDLEFRTNYSEIDIKKNIVIALNIIKNYFRNIYTKNFMAVPLYNKYTSVEYSSISTKLKAIINGYENKNEL